MSLDRASVWDFNESQPPRDLSRPLQALWWLKKGDLKLGHEWEIAHDISQSQEGTQAFDWVHALAHWIEEDFSNANYWYGMAGKKRHSDDVAVEWQYIVDALLK